MDVEFSMVVGDGKGIQVLMQQKRIMVKKMAVVWHLEKPHSFILVIVKFGVGVVAPGIDEGTFGVFGNGKSGDPGHERIL